jgi:CheY-like chemotaxis protein
MAGDFTIANLGVDGRQEDSQRVAPKSVSNLHRLQPVRVLLSGRDRRFMRVTSFLLTRRGYRVAEAAPSHAVAATERHRADVVLLESGESRAVAARKIAALQALASPPSVLIVVEGDEEEQRRWQGLPGVKKWTPIDTLVAQIEAAALSRETPVTKVEQAYP